MKLPLWAWDPKQGKYVVFPIQLLKQFEDGKYGLDWPVLLNASATVAVANIKIFFRDNYRFFEAEKRNGKYYRYVLKESNNATGTGSSGAGDQTEGSDPANRPVEGGEE